MTQKLDCLDPACTREFRDEALLQTHVQTVHPDIDSARTYTAAQRKQAAKAGAAMPSGGFPIRNATDLKNAIQAVGRAKDQAAAKAHIIKRAKALGLSKNLPAGWTSDKADLARLGLAGVECPDCERAFLNEDLFIEHAEAVHTFDDLRQMVSEELRETFGIDGDTYDTTTYVYLVDIADDWVVFQASKGNDSDLFKCSYSVIDGDVTFGSPFQVQRRTVYDPVNDNDDAPDSVLSVNLN